MKKAIIAAVIVLAAGAAFFVYGPGPDAGGQTDAPANAPSEQAEGTEAAAALTVSTAPPQFSIWPETVEATGWTAAWQEVVISAEVGGQRIETLGADVGDTVKQGDLLVELSRETLDNNIDQLEAALESAQASLEQAAANSERARRLQNSGSGALSQQDAAEYYATERKSQADVSSAEAQLASARLDLQHATIAASYGGVISSRSAVVGDVVTEGAELYRLIRDGRIEWQAEVPLRQLRDIRVDTPVTIPTPLGEVTGAVTRIAPSASETNGRVKVYVALNEPEEGPEPKIGVMISGRFTTDESEALHVPSTAVVLQDGFSYIFVLDDDDPTIVRRERVETGRRRDDRVALIADLSPDAQVVQTGGAFLSDGAKVRVSDGETEAPAGDGTDMAKSEPADQEAAE
ncbi:MAG: efflux transporter periplasmic adaptor subunit [Erythrobacter sp.]|nr:efflux transporter periplasmic adaptor subunit [Erythrobacter sp.]